MLKYLCFRLAALVIPWLPEAFGYRLAILAGELAYRLAAGARAAVIANQRQVLGDEASPQRLAGVVRGVFRTTALNYYDFFRLHRYDLARLNERVAVEGLGYLEKELQGGKGVILATAHLGNLDLVLQLAAARSLPITVVVEPLEPPRLMGLVSRLRSSRGVSFAPVGVGGLKAIYRALERGEIVALAADRNIGGKGSPFCFLGRETLMPLGAAELALRTGAALMPAFAVRREGGRFQLFIERALRAMPSGDHEVDVRRLNSRLIAFLEKYVRRYPEQWVVFQPIW